MTKGVRSGLPSRVAIFAASMPAAASHGLESVMYQTAPKPKAANAATTMAM